MLVVIEGYINTGKVDVSCWLSKAFREYYHLEDDSNIIPSDGAYNKEFSNSLEFIFENVYTRKFIDQEILDGIYQGAYNSWVNNLYNKNKEKEKLHICKGYPPYAHYAYHGKKIPETIVPDLVFYLHCNDFDYLVQQDPDTTQLKVDREERDDFENVLKRYDEVLKETSAQVEYINILDRNFKWMKDIAMYCFDRIKAHPKFADVKLVIE